MVLMESMNEYTRFFFFCQSLLGVKSLFFLSQIIQIMPVLLLPRLLLAILFLISCSFLRSLTFADNDLNLARSTP